MSATRRSATALLVGALCMLAVVGGRAVVAGASAARHTPEHRVGGRRAGVCRHHRDRHRRGCLTAPRGATREVRHRRSARRRAARRPAARRPAGVSGSKGAGGVPGSSSAGGAASGGSATGVSGAGGSPAPEPGGRPTATTEAPFGESPSATGPARVQVLAREYSFTLSRAEVPAGKVIVEFVNGGEDPHNLHLAEPVEGGEAGAFPTSAPGFHGDLTLNLHAGTYTLFCALPGHEAKGMKATLTVR